MYSIMGLLELRVAAAICISKSRISKIHIVLSYGRTENELEKDGIS